MPDHRPEHHEHEPDATLDLQPAITSDVTANLISPEAGGLVTPLPMAPAEAASEPPAEEAVEVQQVDPIRHDDATAEGLGRRAVAHEASASHDQSAAQTEAVQKAETTESKPAEVVQAIGKQAVDHHNETTEADDTGQHATTGEGADTAGETAGDSGTTEDGTERDGEEDGETTGVEETQEDGEDDHTEDEDEDTAEADGNGAGDRGNDGSPVDLGDESNRSEKLRQLAVDVQRVRDTYRGVETETGSDNAPTTETILNLKNTIQEIDAVYKELNDYSIFEDRVTDSSGATIAQIKASINFHEESAYLVQAAEGLGVRDSHYMVRAGATISAGEALYPEGDEDVLYYDILSTEKGDLVQKVEVHLTPPGTPTRFHTCVPLDEELRQVPDLLRRVFDLGPDQEARETPTNTFRTGLEPGGQLLGNHALTRDQFAAAEVMAGATDSIITTHYGDSVTATERIPLAEVELTQGQAQALQEISDEGRQLMTRRYGTVYPVFQAGLEAHLAYNNADHTRTFTENDEKLSSALELPPTLALITGKVVSEWHDADQTNIVRNLPRLGEDERRSAELLMAEMRRKGIPKYWAEIAAYGVLGTWVVVNSSGVVVGQWGGLPHRYPSKDTETAARHGATADLMGIYRPRGPYDSHLLYAQRQGVTPDETPPLDGLGEYLVGQAVFVEGHRFPVEKANTLFTGLKSEIIAYNELVLRRVEAGTIGDPAIFWDNLRQWDIEFMQRHS